MKSACFDQDFTNGIINPATNKPWFEEIWERYFKIFKQLANRLSSLSALKRVLYHGILPMADWLTCSAFTHRARVRSCAQKSFFILLSKFMKIFAYPHFYAGNTMALLFFHENL